VTTRLRPINGRGLVGFITASFVALVLLALWPTGGPSSAAEGVGSSPTPLARAGAEPPITQPTRRPLPPSPGVAATTSLPVPRCRYDDVELVVDYEDWATTLVDTIGQMPRTYAPRDLVAVTTAGLPGRGSVRSLVVDDLRALARAARRAGRPLAVQSAYRSFERQRTVFAEWVAVSGEAEARRFSARPGHSEHQLGTAIDFREANGPPPWEIDFGATPVGRWLGEHAWQFGFVMSYPRGGEELACYGPEPWHFRYVGRDIADQVHSSGMTLREWLWSAGGAG
jgi:D-alanyl-D-alanine carboxypeptidase